MKMHKKLLQVALSAICLGGAQLAAEDLILIPFHEDNGKVVKNLGSLPDAEIAFKGRPSPRLVSPGIGGSGYAVEYTNEQTGRPAHFQAVEIESTGLDNLTSWTLALWFKVDATKYNTNNPVGSTGKITLFETLSSFSNKVEPGISVGLNPYTKGTQIKVQLGDGSNGNTGYFNFDPRPVITDGNWTFLAVTFDASLPAQKLRIYGGDEIIPAKATYTDTRMDEITGTGVAIEGLISIGDGLTGFGPFSSMSGAMDNIYFSSKAMSLEEIEAVRAAGLQ